MGTYDRQIATAKRLITAKGRACTWTQYDDGTPVDADMPWKPGDAASASYSVPIVFLPTSQNLAFLRALGVTDLPAGDDYGLMPSVPFTPTARAEVYDSTGTVLLRKVNSVNLLAPNGDSILYTVYFGVSS